MAVEQHVGGADHEIYYFAGRIDDAETVGTFRIIRLVKIFVDDLEEGLFLARADDASGVRLNALVVMFDLAEGVALRLAGEERLFHLAQFAGDAVLLQHLRVTENGEKNFLGEDVLDEHFIHVVGRDGGIDGRATEIKERFAPLMKGAIGLALLENHAAQGGDDAGDVVF